MKMTAGEIQSLWDRANMHGDSESSGNCYYPRVVARLADTALSLADQLRESQAENKSLKRTLINISKILGENDVPIEVGSKSTL